MKKTKKSMSLGFYAGILLLSVILISFHISGGLYARFTTSATASDSARVAAYVFELVNEDQNIEMPVTYTADGSGVYEIQVKNNNGERTCEVAQSYVITVENLTNNVDFTFALYSDEQCQNMISGTPTGTLPAGSAETDTFYLKISLPANADHSLAYEIDLLNISVSAEQID